MIINLMKSRGQNHKITQIISLSQNYKIHRNNVDSVKPAIDSLSKKRRKQVDKLATERLRYRQAVRNFNDTALFRENQRMSGRITNIILEDRRKKSSLMSPFATVSPEKSLNGSRSNKKLNSVSSSRSLTSVSSNYRQRTLRQKEVERENLKLAARITNPKSIRKFTISELNKSYQKQQEVVRTRSRFSNKNQEIIRSLALQGLKFDKKYVQYLPQLTHKRGKSLATQKSRESIA